MTKSINKSKGFTIVELLVVIVVIGILAAITIVSYTGITKTANINANKANADVVRSAASAFYAEKGSYPATAATSAAVITNFNAGNYSKLATGVTVTNVTVTDFGAVSYRVNSGGTGICVGYWDGTVSAYIYAGTATADNGTCS
ncbi:MAG: prepilin-type N-terminal cleavage/methylation domain-containing protein [Candidatus Saccharibacteria bacterium]